MGATVRTTSLIPIAASGDTGVKTVDFGPNYDPNSQRSIIGNMNAGDTVVLTVYGIHVDPNTRVETIVSHVLQSFTGSTSFAYTLNGPIQRIGPNKTGTAGAATIFVMG